MTVEIKNSTQLDTLLLTLEKPERGKGSVSAYSHLNTALKEWRVEQNWERDNAFVISEQDLGYAFFMFTKRDPCHYTLRHIFTLEEARGKGIGKKLIAAMLDMMSEHNVERLRFFANKPAIGWYESLGFTWHGISKTGLPFYYGDKYGSLIELPKGQKRYVVSEIV